MARYHIRPSRLKGTIQVPSSKSHSLRAILFAAMGKGPSRVRNLLPSPDAASMVRAMQMLGATIETSVDNSLLIRGTHGKVSTPDDVIYCGNSGIVLRFAGALAALQDRYAILSGYDSIRHLLPVQPLLDGLEQLGATAYSSRLDGHAPIVISGPLKNSKATLTGEDSQPVSGLLIAAAFAPHPICLRVEKAGEKPWIGLTLYWFDLLGIPYKQKNFEQYEMQGNASIEPFDLAIPGDFSSAAFPIAAALITRSNLIVTGLDPKDPQGDKLLLDVLIKMGARIVWEGNALHIYRSQKNLKGIEIDVNDFIDAVPILAVVACYAEGETRIVNAAIARKKECDRLKCIAHELRKMGAQIEELPDGLIIQGAASLSGAHFETYHDHRMVLALSVAALGASGESTLVGIECASKSYPAFHDDFRAIGAEIDLLV
jgi:3-phosphoshikimate 1-carboxyvinyltransferase